MAKELSLHLQTFIALLRGINVGGKTQIPMAELRSLCSTRGWVDVQTYIQSGNVIFRSDSRREQLEEDLEEALQIRFGFEVSVLVRTEAEWTASIRENPFREISDQNPSRVMLVLSKVPPRNDSEVLLQERSANGERVARSESGLWIHFPNGSGRSKLGPAFLERSVGSAVTTRNWRTVVTISEIAGAMRR